MKEVLVLWLLVPILLQHAYLICRLAGDPADIAAKKSNISKAEGLWGLLMCLLYLLALILFLIEDTSWPAYQAVFAYEVLIMLVYTVLIMKAR